MMCEWGNEEKLLVPMPAELSHTGQFRWAIKGVDACIAPLVQALNEAGVYTANCCCGHGKAPGWIALHDGRHLLIVDSSVDVEEITKALGGEG
jgi:hypothetical protein